MRLEVGSVDHQPIGLAALRRKLGKYPIEDAKTAPTDEAIIDRLVWTVLFGRIAPAKPVTDNEDDPADDPLVVNAWNAMRQRKIGLDPAHLRLRQPDQIAHRSTSGCHQ